MKTEQFVISASPGKVRMRATVTLARNLCAFLFFCYATNSLFFAFDGLVLFLYFSWKLIPEIVTGMSFVKTSARTRGVTLLFGLVFTILIIIALFLAGKYPAPIHHWLDRL